MPLFNPKISPGLAINDDAAILDFFKVNGDNGYIDAKTALKNSDIYSLIYQLSADLAGGRFEASSSRTQGMLEQPTKTANAHGFWQSMYAQMLLGGEAFAYRWRNQNGTDLHYLLARGWFRADLQHQF